VNELQDYTIRDILDALKRRLDKNNEIFLQSTKGYCYTGKCTFNEPTTSEAIDKFSTETGWSIPNEYREFLLIHNGANFFSFEYGGACYLNSLEQIMSDSLYCISKDFYSIGSYTDLGQVVINSKRVRDGGSDYMFLASDEIIDFRCDFKRWFDRMIITEGINYWEWKSKTVPLDTILNE
jgi:hypothetical protein